LSFLHKFRERVNLAIYDSKERVINTFRVLNVFITLIAFSTLLYYYGFPQNDETNWWCILAFQVSFTFYIFYYFIRFFFDFSPRQFLREHWFEGLFMLIMAIEGISTMIFGITIIENIFVHFGFYNFEEVSTIFIPVYFMAVLFLEVTKASKIKPIIKMNPAMLFMFSFVLIIVGGTFLLMMPEMTSNHGSMPFIDALFTSTSATCVTGLSVVDVSTYFTFKGQVVILLLIQLGGLNIVAFVAFIIMMSKLGIGLKYNTLMDDYAKKGTIESALGMFWKILRWSLIIEAAGAFLFYVFLDTGTPLAANNADRVFGSVFHSISAFNNAGFSIYYDGMHNEFIRFNFAAHIIIMTLIFFGSLGFATMFDIFSFERMRDRMRQPWKAIHFNSKVALYFSIILVVAGALVFYFLEQNNSIKDMDEGGSWVTALFQSITTRTAGFNTVDIGGLTTPVIIFMMFLMFIGASSGSTGGGIKTSTFAILWASTVATIRDRKNVELFRRTIKSETVLKAFTVLLFFIAWNFIAIFILLITEEQTLHETSAVHIIFEQVSAFATAGLSMGITAKLTLGGKIIIILSMYIGKVGALTLAYLFGKPITTNYKYPYADSMVG
jgi:trk system potassium uptake protein TrkH